MDEDDLLIRLEAKDLEPRLRVLRRRESTKQILQNISEDEFYKRKGTLPPKEPWPFIYPMLLSVSIQWALLLLACAAAIILGGLVFVTVGRHKPKVSGADGF